MTNTKIESARRKWERTRSNYRTFWTIVAAAGVLMAALGNYYTIEHLLLEGTLVSLCAFIVLFLPPLGSIAWLSTAIFMIVRSGEYLTFAQKQEIAKTGEITWMNALWIVFVMVRVTFIVLSIKNAKLKWREKAEIRFLTRQALREKSNRAMEELLNK